MKVKRLIYAVFFLLLMTSSLFGQDETEKLPIAVFHSPSCSRCVEIKTQVLPFIEKLSRSQLDEKQATYVDIIKTNITNVVSPFMRQMEIG